MEQKEKLKQIFRLSRFLPVSLGVVSAALLVRILQLNLAVDFATGFFQEDTFLVPLLAVILLLYLAYAVIVLLLHPLRLEQPYKMKNPLPAAVIFGAAGILLLLEGIIALFGTDGMLERITTLLEAASGAVLLYHAVLLWKKEQKRLQNHVFFLVPALWSVLELVCIFVHHTTVANISSYIFEILFSAALVLFLVYYARFTAGLLRRDQKRRLMISGVFAVALGAVTSVPPLFCRLVEYSGIGSQIILPGFSSLAFTLISGLLLFLFVRETLASGQNSSTGSAFECEYGCESVGVEGLYRPNRSRRKR